MDNATWHKTSHTLELIHMTGAKLLYLPLYSPDLNPVEHDFANIKKRWQDRFSRPTHQKNRNDVSVITKSTIIMYYTEIS